ncbi:MAG: hypothetical protein HFG28_12565 [Eubacterium sp.]|nr:hypothetical protein [Eubacterium sp.]
MGAYGYAEFGTDAMVVGYSSQKSVGDSGAEGKYSAFGEMSEGDGVRYNQWMKLREDGLDQAKINDIIIN